MEKDGRRYICIDCGSVDDASLEEAMRIIQSRGLKVIEQDDWIWNPIKKWGNNDYFRLFLWRCLKKVKSFFKWSASDIDKRLHRLKSSHFWEAIFFLYSAGRAWAQRPEFLSIGNLHNFRLELLCNLTKDFFLKSLDFPLYLWYIIIRKRETKGPQKKGWKSWKKRKWF